MSRQRLTVVLSQAQGKDPRKRSLEESVAAALLMESGLDVSIVPYLYDLDADHTGRMFLESVPGDMVVLSWMYPRAAYWLLDRCNIKGHYGDNLITPKTEADEDEDEDAEPAPPKGVGAVNLPDRSIYCLDLRDHSDHEVYVREVRRIAAECRERRDAQPRPLTNGHTTLVQLGRVQREEPAVAPLLPVEKLEASSQFTPEQMLQPPQRRWYPVIDYSRCTNCMECLDFCLFGVYGVDKMDRILVENQDSCKKGCPACSRVCPEQAIMFPDYKTPAIAGAPVGAISALKIDLTKLFGGGDALAIAARERDHELVADGRNAVGLTVGIPKRQADKPKEAKDDLDKLMDALDDLEI
jgi:NAD-dependent dihydropyrimidine dehydrogenase PreA subunit